jgi:hypothetical protein
VRTDRELVHVFGYGDRRLDGDGRRLEREGRHDRAGDLDPDDVVELASGRVILTRPLGNDHRGAGELVLVGGEDQAVTLREEQRDRLVVDPPDHLERHVAGVFPALRVLALDDPGILGEQSDQLVDRLQQPLGVHLRVAEAVQLVVGVPRILDVDVRELRLLVGLDEERQEAVGHVAVGARSASASRGATVRSSSSRRRGSSSRPGSRSAWV